MNSKSEEFVINLGEWADQYIKECLSHTKEVVSGSGKVLIVQDRHIPTIAYFLNIWLPMISDIKIDRGTYYNWLHRDDNELKFNTIKKIDEKFKALAADIVANEQKGIFYAKNKLGWTDKQHLDMNATVKQLNANFGTTIQPTQESGDNS